MSGEELLNCSRVNHGTVRCGDREYHLEELLEPVDGVFWAFLLSYLALVLFAGELGPVGVGERERPFPPPPGLMSGLTMGLLSLDIMSLEVLKRGGKPHQQVSTSLSLSLPL